MFRTVMEVFADTARTHPDRPALKVKRGGAWQTLTWRQYHDASRRAARALIALGLEPGKGVSIIGYNSPEWLIADVGAIMAGGFPAGVYTTSSPEQCQYITDHCDAVVAFAENDEQ